MKTTVNVHPVVLYNILQNEYKFVSMYIVACKSKSKTALIN